MMGCIGIGLPISQTIKIIKLSMKRTVLITGGSRGLGATIVKTFYEAGYNVAILARVDSGLADKLGDRAKFFKLDVTRVNEIRQVVTNVTKWAGRIDTLVNNAGYSAWKPLAEIDEFFWNEMINTNLKGLFFVTQAVEREMAQGASIINISSLAGKRGSANNSVYCASKFGVNGVTQSLAKELGHKGIRVNAVCPVYIRTAGLEAALKEVSSPLRGSEMNTFLENFAQTQTALGILPTEQQVADTCLFLASDQAGAITGQCINVDCGVLPQ